jgi:hypothetical protein
VVVDGWRQTGNRAAAGGVSAIQKYEIEDVGGNKTLGAVSKI